jgi:(1->4)-alpha-D-glucan 1-alpha-D-glucosylmutase
MSQNRAEQLDGIARKLRVPDATYRLQFNRDFRLPQATDLAPYLRDLGISDCYASPLFQAGPESTHGYDVCGFDEFNPAIGTREEFETWSSRLRELGLGLILDMVPNHMGADLSNHWWADVLQRGRQSPFACFFDINWEPLQSDLHNRILLPVLEDLYGAVLEAGKLTLACQHGLFSIVYGQRQFPVRFESCLNLLEEVAASVLSGPACGPREKELARFLQEVRRARDLSEAPPLDAAGLRSHIEDWDRTSPAFHESLQLLCCQYNGHPGEPRSFDRLHRLLQEQHYRLAFWRVGPEEINYRRFFDVAQLVSLRMELPLVFQTCHQLVFELLHQGRLSGLRIDHPDGLWDPKEYFRRLQAGFLQMQLAPDPSRSEETERSVSEWLAGQVFPLEQEEQHDSSLADDDAGAPLPRPTSRPHWPLYAVAEKILTGDEPLRRDWAVAGSTGYDFLNKANGLFVDSVHEQAFDSIYRSFSGTVTSFPEMVHAGKKQILQRSLISESQALAHRLKQLAQRTRYGQDFTLEQLQQALLNVIATLPVYRSYVTEEARQLVPREQVYLEQAVLKAKASAPYLGEPVFDFVRNLLLLRSPPDFDDEAQRLNREFVMRFQQLSGPTTAKGVEDTAFYRYNRLISLNEVGGDPDHFGVSLDEFHRYNLNQAERWPNALLASATHDTKRGEDARARLNVLSEMPADWASAIQRWHGLNADKRTCVDSYPAPDANDEYLLYQTLIGAWPWAPIDRGVFVERIVAYMLKAVREAKVHTTWTEANTGYEDAVRQFVQRILDPSQSEPFLRDFQAFQRKTAFLGVVNSLAQLLLKATCPGVPDFYQGTELWDLNLVDPDNRRPVDYTLRRRLLNELRSRWSDHPEARLELIRSLLENAGSGELKLHVMTSALALRHQHPTLYSGGKYVPLRAVGPKQEHVCCFARVQDAQAIITVVPRLVCRLTRGVEKWPLGEAAWQDTRIDLAQANLAGNYTNVLTGEEVEMAADRSLLPIRSALRSFPVALLKRDSCPPL